LLFKGVNGDLDHWVLGDSFMKTFHLIFDAENNRIGVMTNSQTLGWDHEDLISFNSLNDIFKRTAMIIAVFIITSAIILIYCIVRIWKKRKSLKLIN